jgi:hypothetical protein
MATSASGFIKRNKNKTATDSSAVRTPPFKAMDAAMRLVLLVLLPLPKGMR